MKMRKIGILLVFLLAVQALTAATRVEYQKQDSEKIVKLLIEAKKMPKETNFPIFFARKFLGVKYVAHTLDVSDDEHLIINTRQLDCTTLIENVTALSLCAYHRLFMFRDFCAVLTSLRYRGGCIKDYTSRLHYFSDWIDDNVKLGHVSEMQGPLPPFTSKQTINLCFMSLHPSCYRSLILHPDLVSTIRRSEQRLNGLTRNYIPKLFFISNNASLKCIQDGDILAITTNKPGLDIAHLGFAVWCRDGLHLLNASSIHHKVVKEKMTLGQYLSKHPSHTGIRVIRISNKKN
jgi:hypothetical protein